MPGVSALQAQAMISREQYFEALAAGSLFTMAVVMAVFTRRWVEIVRKSERPNSSQGRFVHSRAYVPFVRVVGLGLFFFWWLTVRHCFHLQP
jgi:hypothetical protein